MSSQQPPSRRLRRPLAIAVALGLGFAGPLVVATPAFAATWIVTVETDVLPVPDVGSLRWAVGQAASGDTITFDTSTVDRIDLVTGLDVPKGITIDGPGRELLTIGRASTVWFHQFRLLPDVPDQDYTIRDLTVEGRADGTGVGILASTGGPNPVRDLTLSSVVVQGEINNFGPAVNTFHLTGDLVIDDSRFQNNSAMGFNGGAMSLLWVEGDITITNSQLLNNTATTTGGAIDIEFNRGVGSEILISDTVFDSNSAGSGGGLAVRGARDVELSGVTFDSNSGLTRGGGAYISWDTANPVEELRIEDSEFNNNVSGQEGGGLAVDHLVGAFELVGSVFDGNESNSANGGGISIDEINEDSRIFGSTFHQNDANAGYGGGVYVGDIMTAPLEITDSSFLENRSQLGGGGLAVGSITGGGDDGLAIYNSTFADNGIFSGLAGGSSIAVQSVGAPFFLGQVTVDDADSVNALGAVYIEGVNRPGGGIAVGVVRSTIVGPGGVMIDTHTEGEVVVISSILDSVSPTLLALEVFNPSNGFQLGIEWSLLSTGMQPYFNDVGGNTFNVADMELGTLADNGGPTATRLPLTGSPAIDAGDPLAPVPPGDFDQREDGFPRVVGGRIDIGAVELQTLALAATGATVNWFLLGGGGVLLLLGVGLLVWVRVRRSAAQRQE